MSDSPAVIIGNPASIFPRHLASLWRSLGLDPVIVARHWSGERVLPDGTRILASADAESPNQRRAYRALERLLDAFEARLHVLQKRRYASAMGLETHYKPRASPAIVDALSISRFTRTLGPQLVCGQEVFAYGLAASLCRGCPRLVMPWGGDVYMYAETTSLAFALVKYALRHVDLVVAGSPLAADHLQARFGVPPERLHCRRSLGAGSGTVPAGHARREPAHARAIRDPPRRSRDHERAPVLPGVGIGCRVRGVRARRERAARRALRASRRSRHRGAGRGCARKTRAGRPLVTIHAVRRRPAARRLRRAHVDRRHLRVAHARDSTCGRWPPSWRPPAPAEHPVVGDQPEYRAMEQLGFSAIFAAPGDAGSAAAAIERYASDAAPSPAGRRAQRPLSSRARRRRRAGPGSAPRRSDRSVTADGRSHHAASRV